MYIQSRDGKTEHGLSLKYDQAGTRFDWIIYIKINKSNQGGVEETILLIVIEFTHKKLFCTSWFDMFEEWQCLLLYSFWNRTVSATQQSHCDCHYKKTEHLLTRRWWGSNILAEMRCIRGDSQYFSEKWPVPQGSSLISHFPPTHTGVR